MFGTAVSAHSQVMKGIELVDDSSKSKLDDIFEAEAKNAIKHIEDEIKLFEDEIKLFDEKLRAPKNNTTNVCTGITPGNRKTCGGKSCVNNTGTIGNCSCVSTSNSTQNTTACESNSGTILSDSCNGGGEGRCAYNGFKFGSGSGDGYISNSSCNTNRFYSRDVCAYNGGSHRGSGKGFIGENSCNNAGSSACDSNGFSFGGKAEGYIESNSCNDGKGTRSRVCFDNGESLLNYTSYGRIEASSCNNGTNSCNYNGKSKTGDSYGIIGAHSCNNGTYSCNYNGYDGNGTIGEHSCNGGRYTCRRNGYDGKKGTIGNNACNAPGACEYNEGTIDDGCCNYANACFGNNGTIKLGDVGCLAPTIGATSAVTTPNTSIVLSLVTFSVALVQILLDKNKNYPYEMH